MEWEQKYPLVSVHAMQRAISDHTPLLVDSGEATHIGNKNIFSFELSWFEKENFIEMVAREWARPVAGRSSMERWQNKIRHLRQFLRGWARNESGIYKQEKERLI
jgi:hypothetical protein